MAEEGDADVAPRIGFRGAARLDRTKRPMGLDGLGRLDRATGVRDILDSCGLVDDQGRKSVGRVQIAPWSAPLKPRNNICQYNLMVDARPSRNRRMCSERHSAERYCIELDISHRTRSNQPLVLERAFQLRIEVCDFGAGRGLSGEPQQQAARQAEDRLERFSQIGVATLAGGGDRRCGSFGQSGATAERALARFAAR